MDDLRRVVHTSGSPAFESQLEQLMTTGYDFDLDEVFRTGLRLLLDGWRRQPLGSTSRGGSSQPP